MGLFGKRKKESAEARTPSQLAYKVAERIGCPCKIFPKGTNYRLIEQEYQGAAALGKAKGFTPVLVCVDDLLCDALSLSEEDGFSVEDLLKAGADEEAGKRFLAERFQEYRSECEAYDDWSLDEFIGAYSGKPERITTSSTIYNAADQGQDIILVEVPSPNPWDVVAFIPFGGWNECPAPADMANVLRYWFEKHGAVPMVITSSTLEFAVPAPVGEAEALELAKEHFAFSMDRVDQGTETGTLSELVESLKVSTAWFFWWD